jgi:hypothetical protein
MNKWSDKLIELSREYLNYTDTHVKSLNGQFGILYIDYDNQVYTIKLRSTNQELTFKSVNDIINNGWAVD